MRCKILQLFNNNKKVLIFYPDENESILFAFFLKLLLLAKKTGSGLIRLPKSLELTVYLVSRILSCLEGDELKRVSISNIKYRTTKFRKVSEYRYRIQALEY
jgi:hypothetical protein